MSAETALLLLWPAAAVIGGIALALMPRLFRARARARYEQRLAARLARGTDAYFEELRSLRAYPPPARALIWRGLGGVLIALGANETYYILTR